MSGEPKTLTPEQEKAAREAFETRYRAFAWWTERFGTQHPALRKDENGDYLEEGQRKYWTGFQEGYAAALGVPVVARDEAAELRAAVREYLAAMDALDGPATGWSVAETNRAVDALNELRRLAGGESQR